MSHDHGSHPSQGPAGGAVKDPVSGPGGGVIYTCPMHPEVRQIGPGACPKCGMALEPLDAAADQGPNPEIADFTRRLIVATVLSLPLFVMEMGSHLLGLRIALPHGWPAGAMGWVQFALATPVVLWAGWPFIARGWASVRTWSLNMFTLIALGTLVAWGFSTASVIAPGMIPDAFKDMHGQPPLYFEAAAVIVALVLLGQVLELRARERTSGAIRACWTWRRRPPCVRAPMGPTRRFPWVISWWGTACACVPARRFRLTASWSKAAPRSMNPWSRANPCR